MKNKICAIGILAIACLWVGLDTAAARDLNLSLEPDSIMIGAAYNGKKIAVTGTIPSRATALIRVTGRPEHSKLKQKGRALGILWMNLGSVEISNAPNVYLLFLPEGAPDAAQLQQPDWRHLGIGMEAVRQEAHIVAADADKDGLFAEFVKLKEKSGLYDITDNAVQYGPANGPMKPFSATLALPAALPQGTYRVEVLAVEDGAIAASAARQIEAREVGIPAWISDLAFNHGTIYGMLAVLVALVAGLATGIMFKGDKGSH